MPPRDVLGRLAHLPVVVLQRSLESGLDLGPLKGRQGDHDAAADLRSVVERGDERGDGSSIPDRPESRNSGLPAQRVAMFGDYSHERLHRTSVRLLAHGEARCLHDGFVGVEEQLGEVGAGQFRGQLADGAPHCRRRVGEGGLYVGRSNFAEADEGGEGCSTHLRLLVPEELAGRRMLAGVACHRRPRAVVQGSFTIVHTWIVESGSRIGP